MIGASISNGERKKTSEKMENADKSAGCVRYSLGEGISTITLLQPFRGKSVMFEMRSLNIRVARRHRMEIIIHKTRFGLRLHPKRDHKCVVPYIRTENVWCDATNLDESSIKRA